MPEDAMVRPIHTAVKGRARFKVQGLHGCSPLRDHLQSRLSAHERITEASPSSLTGNVLVRYNSGSDLKEILALIESLVQEYQGAACCRAALPSRLPGPTPEAGRRVSSPKPALQLKKTEGGETARFFQGGGEPQPDESWHTLTVQRILELLASSARSGLTVQEAADRLAQYGPNALPEADARSGWSILFDQFKSLPVALLGAAAGVSVVTGGLADAIVILAVVGINGVIGYVTESEAEKTIHSLKQLVKPTADVLRDGAVTTLPAEVVVPGDVLVLRPGAYVAADARLLECSHLSLDESVLTGESMPVVKTAEVLARQEVTLGDRVNMVYMGTLVTGGQGLAVVVATGAFTEVGRLQALVGEAKSPETPMERQLDQLGDQLVLISGAACAVVFGIGLLRGYGFLVMFKTAISLAVAAVPEGLPAVATTTLSLGIRNMKRHRVLIRQLNAIETLGCIQTICFDKTGTITMNRMAVVRLFAGMKDIRVVNGSFRYDGTPVDALRIEELRSLIEVSVLCNETEIEGGRDGEEYVLRGSPTESALITMAIQTGIDVLDLRGRYPLRKVNYRSENRLFMGTLHELTGENRHGRFIAVKGSPVEVLSMCDCHIQDGIHAHLTEDDRARIELENDRMAADALRVLGLACLIVESDEDFGVTGCLVWLGLIGMADPVRPGVSGLIREFHRAGIDTIMITGDQSPTAYAIGKELDLSRGEPLEIMDSTHLASMDAGMLEALSERVHVFARVTPAFKLQIVQALQARGRVVAMTGDGINDGPALKAADIGIAMGQGGTDIAREVADVVLEEDNLETVIVAVRDGRTIYNNIRKSLHFLLATNFSEIMVMFLTVAAGLPSPMSAMQLLWINLLSDIFPGLALAMEEPEKDILDRPPRPPEEPIVKGSDFKRLTFEASTLSLGAMAAYGYGIMRYGTGVNAGTLAFHSLTSAQLLHALSCRSEKHSFLRGDRLPSNPYLGMALGGSFALQLLTVFVPGLRGLLGLTPIGLMDGAVIAATAALPLLVNESTKAVGADG
ncbi:MAG: cation-transporting P-type ATPase [Syntrophobacteraceae bacterium]|nr:cation-transporting P-type ATPase [Syntrophobacteraceae bacterium]